MHIQPQAYFSKKTPDAVSTTFAQDIIDKIGPLTPEEKVALGIVDNPPEEEVDVDIISRD